MGRGVATLVTLAFSASEADQQQAAGMIANYLLRREYLLPLIDGGPLPPPSRPPASGARLICEQTGKFEGTVCWRDDHSDGLRRLSGMELGGRWARISRGEAQSGIWTARDHATYVNHSHRHSTSSLLFSSPSFPPFPLPSLPVPCLLSLNPPEAKQRPVIAPRNT